MIPVEAVEAAKKAWREQAALDGSIFEYNLQAALEAALPFIQAQTLRDASDAYPLETAYGGAEHAVMWLKERASEVRAAP